MNPDNPNFRKHIKKLDDREECFKILKKLLKLREQTASSPFFSYQTDNSVNTLIRSLLADLAYAKYFKKGDEE